MSNSPKDFPIQFLTEENVVCYIIYAKSVDMYVYAGSLQKFHGANMELIMLLSPQVYLLTKKRLLLT